MKLSTIFEALSYGELRQLFLGGNRDEGIHPTHTKEVLSHLNMAMHNLYTKFPLAEEVVKVLTIKDREYYPLVAAKSIQANAILPYILDTPEYPFTENILNITNVIGPKGEQIPINDYGSSNSMYTPEYNVVQLPDAEPNTIYTITFRAEPPKITLDDPNNVGVELTPEEVDVPLPPTLLEPLLTYIGSRAHNSRGGEAGKKDGFFMMQRYESMCEKLDADNIFHESFNRRNFNLEKNGWV